MAMWVTEAPEPRYAAERGRLRRLPGLRPRRARPARHRQLGEQHRGDVGAPLDGALPRPPRPVRPRHLLRQARRRAVRSGADGRAADARAVDGRRPRRPRRRRLRAGRADRRRRGRPDGDDVRRDLPAAHARPGAGEHVRAGCSAPTTTRSGCPRRPRSGCSSSGSAPGAAGIVLAARRAERGRRPAAAALGRRGTCGSRRRPRPPPRIYRWVLHARRPLDPARASRPRRWSCTGPATATTGAPMGRYLAEHIPGATYVELPGSDWYPAFVDAEPILDEIEEFLTGDRPGPADDRVLATVLFTDIVGSTDLAARLGDQRWLELKAAHDALVRVAARAVPGHGGRHHRRRVPGDLRRPGPGRALRLGDRDVGPRRSASRSGPDCTAARSRCRTAQIAGIAVHIAARVMALAEAGRVLVSGTVKDLVVGSPSGSTTAGRTRSRACRGNGGCSRSSACRDAAHDSCGSPALHARTVGAVPDPSAAPGGRLEPVPARRSRAPLRRWSHPCR